MRMLMVLTSLILLGPAGLAAADLTGTWKGQLEGGQGARELTFRFKVEGGSLTGTVTGLRDREVAIENGKTDGATVSFSVMSEWQGNPVKLVYNGKVSGDQIQFTMGTEDGGWSTELTAKRVS